MQKITNYFTVPLIVLQETDSSNNFLTQLCDLEKYEDLTTLVVERQTAGKGQRGNSWESDAYKNLTYSFVLHPHFIEVRNQFILSQIVSLSIKEVLSKYTDDITIKWPNDIYWKEKKICGILIENSLSGHCIERSIVGIGLNINQEVFRSDAPNPVSLKQITGEEYDRYQVLERLMNRIKLYYSLLKHDEEEEEATNIAKLYHESLFRKDGYHRYTDDDGEFTARLVCVEPDGRYVLEDEEGNQRKYLFKEVQYVL